jgi:hypothetical protein
LAMHENDTANQYRTNHRQYSSHEITSGFRDCDL